MAARSTSTGKDAVADDPTPATVFAPNDSAPEPETDEREDDAPTEDEALDQVASVQSGFATREPLPLPEVLPVVVPALNVATLDGIPALVDRATKMFTDPASGAIVSVPADYEPAPTEEDKA